MISLQTYTVRDAMKADPLGTLERIAQIGYPGVEIGGYANSNRDQLVAKIRELGLTVTGTHVGIDALRDDLEGVIEENKALDNSFVIVPFIGPEYRGSAENWRQTAAMLEEFGQKLHEAAFTLCYHNHAFELEETFEGQNGLELLYEAANPQFLQAELDVYWVQKGGGVPAEYIRRYAERSPVLHVKDMMPDGSFGEVGQGILDWPAIFAAAKAANVVHYVVEQDVCPGDPFESIATSLANLEK